MLFRSDTDTLRQMIAQSMAQLVSSVFTLTVVFFCMLYISIWLTLIVCAVMTLILVFVRKLTGRIGGYFMAQQTALADLNGYVEEMVNGQKVVKVFCHEGQSKAELHRRNRVWAENAARAIPSMSPISVRRPVSTPQSVTFPPAPVRNTAVASTLSFWKAP